MCDHPLPSMTVHWSLITAWFLASLAAPGRAGAEELVVFPDGRTLRVERAEVLPDRVRIQTITGSSADLPRNVPAKPAEPNVVEVPRRDVRAVLPLPDLPKAVQPHVDRYADIAPRLTEQVQRDLRRSWSLPSSPRR